MKQIPAPWEVILRGDEITAHHHDLLHVALDVLSTKSAVISIQHPSVDNSTVCDQSRCRELFRTNEPHNTDRGILCKYAEHFLEEIQSEQNTPGRQVDLILRVALLHRALIGICNIPAGGHLDQLHRIALRHIYRIEILAYGRDAIRLTLRNDGNFLVIHKWLLPYHFTSSSYRSDRRDRTAHRPNEIDAVPDERKVHRSPNRHNTVNTCGTHSENLLQKRVPIDAVIRQGLA